MSEVSSLITVALICYFVLLSSFRSMGLKKKWQRLLRRVWAWSLLVSHIISAQTETLDGFFCK